MGDYLGKILVVDDEPSIRETLKIVLQDAKYDVLTAESGMEAIQIVKSEEDIDLLITDIRMPNMDGIELFEEIKAIDGTIEAVVISAYSDVKKAVTAIKLGAFDYLQKDFTPEKLLITVEKALERRRLLEENKLLKRKLKNRYKFDEDLVFQSSKIANLCDIINQVAPTKASILITGESGVGKEVFARSIHKKSDRSDAPFIAINCATLPDELLESELFGHEKGSFTGAITDKKGKFEVAHKGTIFLDEIADISPLLQTKLLRFLQEREFERVGGLKKIKVDVRILSATNKDLTKAMDRGEFREDLYYRLNVINLHIPPLRERRDDIPLLAQYFLNQYNQEYVKNINLISAETMGYLLSYDWPGNVRELKNAVERAVAIANVRDTILLPRHLPGELLGDDSGSDDIMNTDAVLSLAELEKLHILNTLELHNWSKSSAAIALGISRQTLYNKMKQYEIS